MHLLSKEKKDLMNMLADKPFRSIYFCPERVPMTSNFCFPSSSPINSMMASGRNEWPSDLNVALQVVSSFYVTYFMSEIKHPLSTHIIWIWKTIIIFFY